MKNLNKDNSSFLNSSLSGDGWEHLFKKYEKSVLNYSADSWIISNIDFLQSTNGFILDAGCGDGRHLLEIAKKGCNIIGLDYSETILHKLKNKILKKGLSSQCYLIKSDIHERVLSQEVCSGGVCTDVLSIVDYPQKILKNLHCCSRKDAIFLITLQNINDETYGKGQLISKDSEGNEQFMQNCLKYRFFTKKGINNIINKNDWEVMNINEYTRDDPPHEHRTTPHRHVLFGCIIKAK